MPFPGKIVFVIYFLPTFLTFTVLQLFRKASWKSVYIYYVQGSRFFVCDHTDPTYLSTSVFHSTFPAGVNKANLETTQNDNLPLHKELVQ